MKILVIAEHDGHVLKPASLSAIAAARGLDASVEVLVTGDDLQAVAQYASGIEGVARVLTASAPHLQAGLAENLAAQVLKIATGYSHIVAAATAQGKNVAPRIAAGLDVAQVSDVTAIVDAQTYRRFIYAGNGVATVKSRDAVQLVTVRASAFDAAVAGGAQAPIEAVEVAADTGLSRLVERAEHVQTRPELGAASVVVSGGRGLGSGEKYRELLEPLADALGAALGASRAAVDAGYVPNDYQVGQTGKIVAPALYIAVGISGAIQHLAGMRDAKTIVAINKDAEAPIFEIADYGLVGDLFELVPELTQQLAK